MRYRIVFMTVFMTTMLLTIGRSSVMAQATLGPDAAGSPATEQHRMLARSNGHWTGDVTVWFAADKPPIKSTSELTNHMDSSGLFQISEIRGNISGAGRPFIGVRITGYDAKRKVFTRAMIQDYSPGVAMEGSWNEATRSFSMPFKQVDGSGVERSLKEVYTFVDEDTEILEIYDTGTKDGKEFKILKVVWKRQK